MNITNVSLKITTGFYDENADVNYSYWAVGLTLLVLTTLFGNCLVVLAVVKFKSLQSVTNYLIVSLAVADIMVGTLVMPLAVYVEVMNGKFLLHDKVCDSWVALDVLACTASILMLMAISIDRYLAVSYAVFYAHKLKHSTTYTIVMIGAGWIISIAIAIPIFAGANNTSHRVTGSCAFFNPVFSNVSSMVSFFIPSFVMIFLYWRIFKIIRQRTQRKKSIPCNNGKFKTSLNSAQNGSSIYTSTGESLRDRETIDNNNVTEKVDSSESSATKNGKVDVAEDVESLETGHLLCKNSTSPDNAHVNARKASVSQEEKSLLRNFSRIRKISRWTASSRKKDRREKLERKATITLLVVMCIFLICWIPFFLVNNLDAMCLHYNLSKKICNIPGGLYSAFVWLGYINSMLNPIIYALLNVEYRKAFKKILCKKVGAAI